MPNESGSSVSHIPSSSKHFKMDRSVSASLFKGFGIACLLAGPALAQGARGGNFIASASVPNALSALPDAPGISSTTTAVDDWPTEVTSVPRTRHAGRLDKFIEPTEIAPPLTAGDKVLLGIRSSVTPFTIAGWVGSATYGQITDGTPNYGQNFRGFSQRLGAAAARSSSEDIFTDSIFAPLLHQDPRYYELGRGHNPAARAVYAISRVFITRTDGGRTTLNLSLLAGNGAGAALTQTYYPPINRGVEETAKTFGTSLGGSALGFVLSEFLGPAARRFELKHSD